MTISFPAPAPPHLRKPIPIDAGRTEKGISNKSTITFASFCCRRSLADSMLKHTAQRTPRTRRPPLPCRFSNHSPRPARIPRARPPVPRRPRRFRQSQPFSGNAEKRPIYGRPRWPKGLHFEPPISGSDDGSTRLWDAHTGTPLGVRRPAGTDAARKMESALPTKDRVDNGARSDYFSANCDSAGTLGEFMRRDLRRLGSGPIAVAIR